MKNCTLLFILDEYKILLGLKKKGFGCDKWNGFGGKIMSGESPETAAVREIKEEADLTVKPEYVERVAEIDFHFAGRHVFRVFVFCAKHWTGTPLETEEMEPRWFSISDIPYTEMWVGDSKWLPLVIRGKKIKALIDFYETGDKLLDFSWQELY